MRYILPSYMIKEVLRTFVPAFCGFGFLILLGLTIQLLHKGLDIIDIRTILPHLMLFACPDALPISFLAAIVMAYGQMSSNNEILAIRTSGAHLSVIITPVIIMSILLAFLTFYLNAELLPSSNKKIKTLKETAVSSILSRKISTVKKKIVFDPYHIYIGKVENNTYKNLAIIEYFKDYVTNILLAEEGIITMSKDERSLVLTLKNGDFAKMNYKKPTEIPMIGSFEEMSFEIPISEKAISTTSKKYMTLSELNDERDYINRELDKYAVNLNYEGKKEFTKTAKKKLRKFKKKYDDFLSNQKDIDQKITDIRNQIGLKESDAENLRSELDTVEGHIAVLNIELERFDVNEGSIDTEKIEEINKKLEEYRGIKEKKRNDLKSVRKSISSGKDELQVLETSSTEIKENTVVLTKEGEDLLNYSLFEQGQKKADDLLISIHKKISGSFLCITFALIGIPLGILTRTGNILISFGISFLTVILVYYPLSVVGVIFAEDQIAIIPSIWGANIVLTILGFFLFWKSLRK